ncbi:MAG: flavin reductase [Promethearchaeota archaeon]
MASLNNFTEISPYELTQNFFSLIHHDSFLITAGTPEKFNMMTAGWGGIGILWNIPVVYLFIRPSRYTYEFVENHTFCTLNFFPSSFKKTINLCGTKSGRDIDKMHVEELSTTEYFYSNETENKNGSTVYFNEANLVLICEKIYYQDLNENNIPTSIMQKYYQKGDIHRLYIGKIAKIFQK